MPRFIKGIRDNYLGAMPAAKVPTTGLERGDTVYVTDLTRAAGGTGNMAFRDSTSWLAVDTGLPVTLGAGGGGVTPIGPDLTLSNLTFSEVAAPETEIGTFSNRRASTSLTVIPDNGWFKPSTDGSKLVVGIIPADVGTIPIYCIEKPLDGVGEARGTILMLTATAQAAVTALDPGSASFSWLGLVGLARLIPGYVGALIRIIDSANVQHDILQNSDGSSYDSSQFSTWGDGMTFTVLRGYDQNPGGKVYSSSGRPVLRFPNLVSAGGDYSGAFIEGDRATSHLVSTDILANVGGVNNLVVMMGLNSNGFISGTTPYTKPNNTVSVNAGTALGYGPNATGVLLRGNAGYTEAETAWYGKRGELNVDAVAPDNADKTRGFRSVYMNQKGAVVSGGGGAKKAFTDRPHEVADAQAQRLVIGANGVLGTAHNGGWKYFAIANPAAPVSDIEVQRLSMGFEAKFSGFVPCRFPKRTFFIAGGQSLMQYYQGFSTSTGNAADDAKTRIFEPDVKGYLGAGTDTAIELSTTFTDTAFGGTGLLRRETDTQPDGPGGTSWLPFVTNGTVTRFWWDQINNLPGPLAMLWRQNVLNVSRPGMKYRRTILNWGQGEFNASQWGDLGAGVNALDNPEVYEENLPKLFAFFRSVIGRDAPILIQPIGRQGGTNFGTRAIRLIQARIAAKMQGVHLSADTQHMTFDTPNNDNVHWGKGPADPNGFDRAGKQLARSVATLMGAKDVVYRGPNIASASKVSPNTVRVKVAWGVGAGGTDIRAVDGSTTGFVGFEVSDSSGARTVTGASRFSANEIDVTVDGAAVSLPALASYIPQHFNLDRNKMVVDNFAGVNMPLRARAGVAVTG